MALLENEELLSEYAYIFFSLTLSISSLFLPFMIYTVYKKSTKEMGPFKLFLLMEIFWSYAFGLVLGMIHPIIYFPNTIARITGPLRFMCTKNGCHLVAELLFFVGVGYAQSLFCTAIFRICKMSPFLIKYQFTYKKRFIILSLALFLPALVYVTPIVLARIDVEEALQMMIQKDASLAFLTKFKEQLVIYNNPTNDDFWIKFIASLLSVTMVLIIIAGIGIMSLITYLTLYHKTKMSTERYKMSMMLLKVMILQVFFAIFLLVLPFCCAIGFVMTNSQYGTIAVLIAGIIASTHSLIEYACVIYTVKPYRDAFSSAFKSVLRFVCRREPQAQMRPISYSISSQASIF